MFAIESKTGIFNTLKKQPQNDKKNVRVRTGISSHREEIQIAKNIFTYVPLVVKIKVSFQSHKFAKTKGSLLLIAVMCDDIGPLTSHWGECELVQSFWMEGSLTMYSKSLENSESL